MVLLSCCSRRHYTSLIALCFVKFVIFEGSKEKSTPKKLTTLMSSSHNAIFLLITAKMSLVSFHTLNR